MEWVSKEELEAVGQLGAAMSSAPSFSAIRFPVWSPFCGKQALICSGPVALPLVSLLPLEVIFILKVFHSNCLVSK